MKPNILYTGSHLLFIWIITAIFLFFIFRFIQASLHFFLLIEVRCSSYGKINVKIWLYGFYDHSLGVREISFWKKNKLDFLTASNDSFEIGKFCDIGSQRWDNCGHVQTGGSLCGSPLLCAVEHLRLVHCKCTRIIMNLYV